jgi:WD40-like Beta Propeller Repeat
VRRSVAISILVFALVAAAAPARASFPGDNGRIAFVRGGDIWAMNSDGTDQVNLTNTPEIEERDPAWSPDGATIAFSGGAANFGVWVMDADGSNPAHITTTDWRPFWSPTGASIGVSTFTKETEYGIDAIDPDGTGRTSLVTGYAEPVIGDWLPDGAGIAENFVDDVCDFDGEIVWPGGMTDPVPPPCNGPFDDRDPSWSPDAQRLAFSRDGSVFTIARDGTDLHEVTVGARPTWSPDGTKIAYNRGVYIEVRNADGSGADYIANGTLSSQSWQPIPINTYPRPRGASPMRISLVPASEECTSPNATHGEPLAFGACTPPVPSSGRLTTGTPDANGEFARMLASLRLVVVPGDESTPEDESDLMIAAHVNHVLNQDLTDYAGSLRAVLPLEITDQDNTPSPGGPGAATTQAFEFGFDVPCTPSPDVNIGSDCTVSTTADSLVPGTIKEARRSVWEIGRVRIDDAGPDGDPGTAADNDPFVVQGVFAQ